MSKFLESADEDFLKMPPPGGVSTGDTQTPVQEETTEQTTDEEVTEQTDTTVDETQLTDAERAAQAEDEETTESDDPDQSASDPTKSQQKVDDKTAPVQKETPGGKLQTPEQTPDVKGKSDPSTESKEKPKAPSVGSEGEETTAKAPDYEGFYKRLIGGPIKANGKDLKLQNEDEVINLVKMGANYTQKMQALAPHRKILMMLESNNLLDEGSLGFLVDLSKKNPDAIKKLVKDSGIDPLDIDVKAESAYKPGNHSISTEEEAFRSTLNDLKTNEHGLQTIQVIDKTWDQQSKEMLYKVPSVMELINEHRENGVYKRIAETIEHRRVTGNIGAQVPFLQAYKAIGEELANAGKLNDLIRPQQTVQSGSVVVPPNQQQQTTGIVRKGQPKKQVVNTDKVNAAAATRSTPKAAKTVVNPLEMSDDDFLKQMKNRV